MSFLSKKFKYINEIGEEVIFDYDHGYLINFPDGVDSVSVKVSTSAGTNNCDGALDIESNLYRLHTGDNMLRPTAEEGLENLNIQISHADEYIGVAVV